MRQVRLVSVVLEKVILLYAPTPSESRYVQTGARPISVTQYSWVVTSISPSFIGVTAGCARPKTRSIARNETYQTGPSEQATYAQPARNRTTLLHMLLTHMPSTYNNGISIRSSRQYFLVYASGEGRRGSDALSGYQSFLDWESSLCAHLERIAIKPSPNDRQKHDTSR